MPAGRTGTRLSVALSTLLAALLLALVAADQTSPRPDQAAGDLHAPAEEAANARPVATILALPAPPPPAQAATPVAAADPPAQTPTATPAPQPAPLITPLKPRPAKVVTPAPERQRRLQPAVEPTATTPARPTPGSEAASAPPAANTDPAVGRALLRMLEHGRGPGLEIAWPARQNERERLYRGFQRCYGMRLAVQDERGRLYNSDGPTGTQWQPNGDRYSGFARLSTGRLTIAERRDIGAIRRLHDLPPGTTAVRVFPRALDAHLLGSLQQLIGGDYLAARAIRARYAVRQGQVLVVELSVDGKVMPGRIDLSRALFARCRVG